MTLGKAEYGSPGNENSSDRRHGEQRLAVAWFPTSLGDGTGRARWNATRTGCGEKWRRRKV